ncbi:RNA polymerase-associated protein RapA [candidate division KSB1 bacterium]|nr:RNA polymerase-associated protein RapA [candidate division KSB1 bacterium]
MEQIQIGQRWISEMEPELGLGIVTQIDRRTVRLNFPASQTERQYVIEHAPIKRVVFKIGDTISSQEGITIIVSNTSVRDGITIYKGDGNQELPETKLSDSLSFTTPQDRLMNDFFDSNREFNLRYRAVRMQHDIRQSPVRGFIGGRIDLIPHQMYVAHETSSRPVPRVLLSDEVGLGKTIEACLIIHRLLLSGRISRVLILVPPTLVHQWFIELYRRFNLIFRILDEDECESICEHDTFANPFLETQLALCSIDFLTSDEEWHDLAIEAGWDMLVVDEAHHIREGSAEYELVERLSADANGLLLLTATPEQLGHRSHFARLRLLDPARYFDFDAFEQESARYHEIAGLVSQLIDGQQLDQVNLTKIRGLYPKNSPALQSTFFKTIANDERKRHAFITDLLDRYGMGRAVFRNTRATMSGFPERIAHLEPLEGNSNDLKLLAQEFAANGNPYEDEPDYNFTRDPRILWLVELLKTSPDEKILLICHTMEKVLAIEHALHAHIKVNPTVFHEELSLLERDRNAAWFANPAGARILICSEIGSEGRNFQFCHHLVMFDLPTDPELLEQRIGRLDRIGQTETIHVHVPYLVSSAYETLARWYHDGMNAFETNVTGAFQLYQELGPMIIAQIMDMEQDDTEQIINATRDRCAAITAEMESGRNRLLELHSFRPDVADELIEQINAIDKTESIDKFMLQMLKLYDIRIDKKSHRTYQLNTMLLSNPEFPLPTHQNDQLTVTFERKTAIHFEDIEFLTWDHPMVMGAIDLIVGSEKGNCAFAVWPSPDDLTLLLEAVFVLECVAPKQLHVDRFLAPTSIRVVVNHEMANCTDDFSFQRLAQHVKNSHDHPLLDNPQIKQELLPQMVTACESIAETQIPGIVSNANTAMESILSQEISRLQELQQVNRYITHDEITIIEQERTELMHAIRTARLRLDALRFIVKGDVR